MSAAFADRRLVKGGLMRATLHAVPAEDYLLLRPAVARVFSDASRLMRGARPDDERLAGLRAEVEAMAATPVSNSELRDRVAASAGVDDAEARDALWWWVRRTTPLLQAPTGGPWSFGRRPAMVAPEAWIGRQFASRDEGLVHLARRYLGALGPATINDAASWSRLAVATLRPAFAALEAADELWHGRDEQGRQLLDLVDAPRPGADVDAPPRLLPMWDGLLLGHADRTRVIDPAHQLPDRRAPTATPTRPSSSTAGWPASGGHGHGERRPRDRARAVRPAGPGDRAGLESRGGRARRVPRRPRAVRLREVPRPPAIPSRPSPRTLGPLPRRGPVRPAGGACTHHT